MSRVYSIKKSRNALISCNKWYTKHWKSLPKDELQKLENALENLEKSIHERKKEEADRFARIANSIVEPRNQKHVLAFIAELAAALVFALVVAIIVRQIWFEPYEIPSGSMRPTYKEGDNLLVSKTAFGINIPLFTDHFYFDPSLIKHGSIVIWSGDKIDLPNTDTTYFGFLPYKKRYIKRLIGKPGDTLFFYGGKVYGIDNEGNSLDDLTHSKWLENLEYIPFITFEGRHGFASSPQTQAQQVLLKHMNKAIGRITLTPMGNIIGEVYDGKKWKEDQPADYLKPHQEIKTFSDIWGIGNFAMARLLTKEEVKSFTPYDPDELGEGVLYLELRHTPSLVKPQPRLFRGSRNELGALLTPQVAVVPLQEEQLNTIMNNMYTARFTVKNEHASQYSFERETSSVLQPQFKDVKDGRYEFYHGKASQIGFLSIPYDLPASHPLYDKSPENIQKLFNLGIEFNKVYEPNNTEQTAFPTRFAYYRNGDLYVLGALLFRKDDPALQHFVAQEKVHEQKGDYIGFIDRGPPVSKEFIKQFGLKVPDRHYLVLGDNHAMSGDSRYFGFVPEENIQGSPTFLFWPITERSGEPPQPYRPWFTFPNLVIWSIASLVGAIWYLIYTLRWDRQIYKKLS